MIIIDTKNICAAALGFFDGVHGAHMQVLRAAADYGAAHGMEPVAVTFATAPRALLAGESAPLICTLEERMRIMREEAGISRVVVLPFDEAMRDMPPERFLREIIYEEVGARYCAAGYDYRFGKGGGGDAAFLEAFCREQGIAWEIVGQMADGAGKISSTRIRELIGAGEMEAAQLLLTRPFSIAGEVVHGKALGRRLGFPTMNIEIPPELTLPAPGVYACHALVEGVRYRAVCNIAHGERPLCEVFVFDYNADAYGCRVRAELLHFIRGMRNFPSLEALTTQVECDKKSALVWLSSR